MRILHGPVNVGNQAFALSRAERRLGAKSDLVVNYQTWLGYGADRVLSPDGERDLRSLARRVGFGLAAPFRYDVIHLYFGQSFLFREDRGDHLSSIFGQIAVDVRLARLLGRRVFMTLQGCDARIAANSDLRNQFTMCRQEHCPSHADCIASIDKKRRRMIDNLLPLCDRFFYLNPELAHELPKSAVFIPYCTGAVAEYAPVPAREGGRPRIVHAPTNAGIKGTRLILQALDALRSRFDFELVLIENTPHAEAMQRYREADLAIDQILAGWYGSFAVELMAMGKPAACAIRDDDLQFVPAGMSAELPLLRLRPDHLVGDLATILERRHDWPELGRRSRRFVERWHNPDNIARVMLNAYRDPQALISFDQPALLGVASQD